MTWTTRTCIFLGALLLLSAAPAANNPFAGTWSGKTNDIPAADLTSEDAGGKLSGSVVFYLQLRGDDGKWRVARKTTTPLIAPRVEARSLVFEVSHRDAHPGESSDRDPNPKFRLELAGENEAWLRHINYYPDAPPVKLVRRTFSK